MKKEIQLSKPNLNLDIVDNLKECIETGWISTGGRFITEFEKKIARYVGTEDAVSIQSGTAGLQLALHVMGVGENDEVIVPTLTFIAAVNPVKYVGASPVFMDCDDDLCLDAEKLERFCSEECSFEGGTLINKSTGRKVKSVIVVHVFGNLANMERILNTAKRFNLRVLEDATEALGSYYSEGQLAGLFAGTIGDMGVYSFNANKIITTGGGGMIVSNHQDMLEKARYLSLTAKDDSLFFVHNEVGYNYRMLNIQAAFGVSQIDELESFIQAKIRNYYRYKEKLTGANGIRILPFKTGTRPNHWFYSLLIDEETCGIGRNKLMHDLIDSGIQCRPVWKLIHTQKPYAGDRAYRIEKASCYEAGILNLPCSTNLTIEDVDYVCEKILEKIR